ncbi:MAG: N-acetylmuramoyl-L-alanine amidase [Candidatus Atribacteria bacterium]|nr:N-acetylmuramoyl-L-alanine amidase [Candidatus Atribacteria bacterium]
MGKRMSHHFKFLSVFFTFLLGFLIFTLPVGARVVMEYQGKSYPMEGEIVEAGGETYVSVESLFKKMGGVEYYSPIMKKVNLVFGGKGWVLSLDKGKAVSEGGEEIPLGEAVLIRDNTVFVSTVLLAKLFDITSSGAPVPPQETPTEPVRPTRTPPPSQTEGTEFLKESPGLLNIRTNPYNLEKRTRITFDFGIGLPYQTLEVGEGGRQLVVSFENADLDPGVSDSYTVNDERVERVDVQKRGNLLVATVTLKSPVTIKKGVLGGSKPRVYLDLVSSTETMVEGTPGTSPTPSAPTPKVTGKPQTPPPSGSPSPTGTLPFDKLNLRVVVIDPGHGGDDPGAIDNKYQEKNVVLEVSRKLKKELIRRGYEVYLTRENDTYPTLKERSALANNKLPVVLLSLHANSCPNPAATGVEVFVGSAQHQGEGAKDVANRENQYFQNTEGTSPVRPIKSPGG